MEKYLSNHLGAFLLPGRGCARTSRELLDSSTRLGMRIVPKTWCLVKCNYQFLVSWVVANKSNQKPGGQRGHLTVKHFLLHVSCAKFLAELFPQQGIITATLWVSSLEPTNNMAVPPWKMMLGRRSFPFGILGWYIFRGELWNFYPVEEMHTNKLTESINKSLNCLWHVKNT